MPFLSFLLKLLYLFSDDLDFYLLVFKLLFLGFYCFPPFSSELFKYFYFY